MKVAKNLYFAIIFGFFHFSTVDTKLAKAFSTVTEVISFGLDLYSFFDSLFEESEESIDYDRIINSISERIDMSTEKIIDKIELQAYVSEVRDVALTIKQLLSELQDILYETNDDKRNEYKRRFRDDFERNKAKVYQIKSLLTFKVNFGESAGSLMTAIVEKIDCSIPQFWEFKNYYMALVSDVVAMALLYEQFSDSSNLYNETLSSWRQNVNVLLSDFQEQEESCEEESFSQARTDFENSVSAGELFRNNHRKYPHLISDILRVGGSYCALVLKGYDKLLRKARGNSRTFLFISSEENDQKYSNEELQRIATTLVFNNCKKSVEMIQLYFHISRQDLVLWLMYPASEAPYTDIFLDNNSTAHVITNGAYKIVVYLRAQDDSRKNPVTAADFDKYFHIRSGNGKLYGMKFFVLGLVVTYSIVRLYISC